MALALLKDGRSVLNRPLVLLLNHQKLLLDQMRPRRVGDVLEGLTVLNYGLPFSFLSGSFARGFLVFLSLKCFRTQILLRWLPLGMDLSSAQSEVRRPSPTLSGLPAPPSTAPSGSAGPSLVSSRSAASAASDLRALSARRPLQWALEPPAPLLLRNQEFRLESLSRTSLATMQNYLLTNLSATECIFHLSQNNGYAGNALGSPGCTLW